jgi:hypothetical protein
MYRLTSPSMFFGAVGQKAAVKRGGGVRRRSVYICSEIRCRKSVFGPFLCEINLFFVETSAHAPIIAGPADLFC